MIPVTEEELARQESINNTVWQNIIEMHEKNPVQFHNEYTQAQRLLTMFGLHSTGMILSAAMLKLYTEYGWQTGQALTDEDSE